MWWGKGEGNGEGRRAWEIGIKEGGRWVREKGGEGKREWENVPVTSYTFSSTIIYIPLSASLCAATSATENVFDILSASFYFSSSFYSCSISLVPAFAFCGD
jgi:hypothetical protein